MALNNGCAVVDIDNQSRQRVTLAVYQTIAVCLLVVGESQRTAHIVGYGDAMIPPRLVNLLLLLEGEHTHRDGADLVVSACNKTTRAGVHIYNLTLLQLAFALHVFDSPRKNPGVTA